MEREEALKLLRQIETYRKTPAMHGAERDITCRIIAAMVAEAAANGPQKSRRHRTNSPDAGRNAAASVEYKRHRSEFLGGTLL